MLCADAAWDGDTVANMKTLVTMVPIIFANCLIEIFLAGSCSTLSTMAFSFVHLLCKRDIVNATVSISRPKNSKRLVGHKTDPLKNYSPDQSEMSALPPILLHGQLEVYSTTMRSTTLFSNCQHTFSYNYRLKTKFGARLCFYTCL